MIKKILIANRGEIACRVISTAKKLGILTVAVYSDIDKRSQHVKMADEAICLGGASASESYLNGALIIQRAIELSVDAIHPGYGFLSENAQFADMCEQHSIIFIGPKSSAIRAMGSKSAAKTIMEQASVPLVPGYHGDEQNPAFLQNEAEKMGYPVLLKAAAGGGGKGMRQVSKPQDFMQALDAAKREAKSSFNDDHMLVEKYLTEPRHVEIQVFCDNHGNGVYLFERDCSVQRRHQKIIEEAPAPGLSEKLREKMGEAALKAAFAINYTGAGTVEFLLDVDGSFYFMEMNTRLQVEHPVTEFISGEDLVEWQITVANNQTLPKAQAQLRMHGHAFEARIYAEDPDNEFLPSTGVLSALIEPKTSKHVRVDTGVVSLDEVSIYYDPMIAKLIVWGENREQALNLLIKSLREYMVCGVTTNIPYLIKVANSKAFRQAQLTTDFIERHAAALDTPEVETEHQQNRIFVAISAMLSAKQASDNKQINYPGFRLNHFASQTVQFSFKGQEYKFRQQQTSANSWRLYIKNNSLHNPSDDTTIDHIDYTATKTSTHLSINTIEYTAQHRYFESDKTAWLLSTNGVEVITKHLPDLGTQQDAAGAGDILAPMNGTLVSMNVVKGDTVKKDQVLAIVEAMKMEHSLKASVSGVVTACFGNAGDLVDGGDVLVSIEATNEE